MDLFTKTVDASLWSSRTYEDPEYDADQSAAETGRREFIPSDGLSTQRVSTLIVACGKDAIRALRASANLSEPGSFNSDDVNVPAAVSGDVAAVYVDVPSSRAAALASSVFSTFRPKKTLVLCSVARWACRGRPHPGIAWIHSSMPAPKVCAAFEAPSFLEGASAAFVSEAALGGHPLAAAVLVKEGKDACYADLLSLYESTSRFVGDGAAECAVPEKQFEELVRKGLRAERATESAMYM